MTRTAPAISPVMQELARYVAQAVRKPLPRAVVEKTKHHVLDTLAAMVSGSRLLPGRKAIAYAKSRGGAKEACVVGSRLVTTVEYAAMANGMTAHADETDDSHAATSQHPGCAIVPAALAAGESRRASGMAFLRAAALGYDVSIRMNQALHAPRFRVVGHSTHSFGPAFGAAAAAASLFRLNPPQVRHVFSYVAQQAGGVGCFQRDIEHVEKAFDFGGLPARNGVTAAMMVAHGCTAVDDVFSGERNFFIAHDESARIGVAPEPACLTRRLGVDFAIMSTNIKRWSVGSPIQGALDSLYELLRTHEFSAREVEKVVVRVYAGGANVTDNREMADICMQHMCALMLVDGRVTFDSAHDNRRMKDPRVLAMRRRIELVADEEVERLRPEKHAIVEIGLTDGRRLRHHTRAVRGTAQNPMTRLEVEEKASGLVEGVLGERRGRALGDAVWNLEKMKDVRSLRPLLVA